jgi:peptidoglycan-N-acetylglucosamine deacetylase
MKFYDPRVRLPEFLTSLFKEAVWRFDENEAVVYLTFDDGPVPEITPWVLQVLERENIKATFFCVGENVMKYPDIYKQILASGHSVGNHTYNHWQGIRKKDQDFFENIEKATDFINSDLFRPPHGWMKRSQYKQLIKNFRIIMWDVISCDYNHQISPEKVISNVCNYVRAGSVITFHDSVKARKNLTNSLVPAINRIKSLGYRFEPIPFNTIKQ